MRSNIAIPSYLWESYSILGYWRERVTWSFAIKRSLKYQNIRIVDNQTKGIKDTALIDGTMPLGGLWIPWNPNLNPWMTQSRLSRLRPLGGHRTTCSRHSTCLEASSLWVGLSAVSDFQTFVRLAHFSQFVLEMRTSPSNLLMVFYSTLTKRP